MDAAKQLIGARVRATEAAANQQRSQFSRQRRRRRRVCRVVRPRKKVQTWKIVASSLRELFTSSAADAHSGVCVSLRKFERAKLKC